MGKQKIVVRVTMKDAKQRSKAMKITVGMPGVISATLEEERIVVVGDGLDPVKLAVTLKKKMGFAELVSVGAAEEKKKEVKKADEAKSLKPATYPYQTVVWPPYQTQPATYPYPTVVWPPYPTQPVLAYENYYEPSCSIM